MDVLIKPIVTEKMTAMGVSMGRYGFIVKPEANKQQIKDAVEDLYKVNVVAVNTMNYGGKNKSRYTKGGMIKGKTGAYKKAIITLKDGEKIDFYSNI